MGGGKLGVATDSKHSCPSLYLVCPSAASAALSQDCVFPPLQGSLKVNGVGDSESEEAYLPYLPYLSLVDDSGELRQVTGKAGEPWLLLTQGGRG